MANCSGAATAWRFRPAAVPICIVIRAPGIRCLIDGDLRVDTAGRVAHPSGRRAWYESGPEPVFAQAGERPTRFIRVMILPRALLGKSSIQYVNEEDKDRSRSRSSIACSSMRR